MRKTSFKWLVIVCLSWVLLGCGREAPMQMDVASSPAVGMAQSKMVTANDAVEGGAEQTLTEASEPVPSVEVRPSAEVKRYIALRHSLMVETSAEAMQAAFDAATAHCMHLNGTILMANFNRQNEYSPPSAILSVRMPPRNVEVFLSGLAKSGEILQHHRESEDKTNQVVDAEARIKNLTAFRDNLRAMLNDKSAKFKDLIEVQRELVNVQSELDSIQSVRKVLAQETELVAVTIDFVAKQGVTEQGFFSPVTQALKRAGANMMDSVASVITFVVVVLPWLLLGIPVFMLLRKLWTKLKKK